MKLTYITYQSFPSNKANTIQTISNLKYISRKDVDVDLIYPDREENSDDNLKKIQTYYQFKDFINLRMERHRFPFGKINFLEKYMFIFSHYFWAKYIVTKLNKENYQTDFYFTRSEWIFYFLSKENRNVTYECHQSSKIKKIIVPHSLKKSKSQVIFLTKELRRTILKKDDHLNKTITLHNGVDEDYFSEKKKKKKNEIVYVGSINRFNKDRNLKFLIDCFKKDYVRNNYQLKIIGGSKDEINHLNEIVRNKNLESKIKTIPHLEREKTIAEIQKSDIGVLINSSYNSHSVYFTSPLKYFEYLRAGLKVIAVDFPAHRDLPFDNLITFFKEDDIDDFEESLKKTSFAKTMNLNEFHKISLKTRTDVILEFIARLEGVEPPTL